MQDELHHERRRILDVLDVLGRQAVLAEQASEAAFLLP
jgi:hypothetical protein